MQDILIKIGSWIVAPILMIGGFLFPSNNISVIPTEETPVVNVGATLPQATGLFETSLQTGITSSATSMTLAANAVRGGGSISGYACFTIDEGSAQAEVICGTVSSTSVTSLLRGISYADGVSEITANKFAHRRGASVKITDFPIVQIIKAQNNGDATFPNELTYAGSTTCTLSAGLCPKSYIDGVAVAGAPNASTTVKGIVEEATQAEIDAGTAAGGTSARLAVNPSTLATSIYNTQLPTSGQKSALVGDNTDIAVGTGNKFVTQTGMQHGAELYAADAGANDTYVITLSPVPTSYTNGMVVRFKANTVNTGAATINVNSLGAKTIVKYVNTTLADGDIAALSLNTLIYDGTNFVLQSPIAIAPQSPTVFKNGFITRAFNGGAGAVTTAHGLGTTPKKIRITAEMGSGQVQSRSTGTYNGTTNSNVYRGENNNSQYYFGADSTNIITMYNSTSTSTTPVTATATFDGTNFTLTWSADVGTGTFYIMWEAEA